MTGVPSLDESEPSLGVALSGVCGPIGTALTPCAAMSGWEGQGARLCWQRGKGAAVYAEVRGAVMCVWAGSATGAWVGGGGPCGVEHAEKWKTLDGWATVCNVTTLGVGLGRSRGPWKCLTWPTATARQGAQEAGAFSRGDEVSPMGNTASPGMRSSKSRGPWASLTWPLTTCEAMWRGARGGRLTWEKPT